jgi:3-oxoacyl-[acyl-carrier protein] reductase
MRIALITGGAGGLGLATAKRFAKDGMTVALTDLNETAVQEAVAELEGVGHRGLVLDVSNEDAVIAAFDLLEREIGPVAVLGHFAGMVGAGGSPAGSSLLNATVDDWDKVMAVNARGTFLCVREMARRRTAAPVEHGRIITISSVAGQMGGGLSGAPYSSSKAAVLGLTRTAAKDLGPLGITVNAISPGPIDTPMLAQAQGASNPASAMAAMVPLRRIGTPDEIAATASFLASTGAAFITGATIDVNGGVLIH